MSSEGMIEFNAPSDYTHVWLLEQLPELNAYPDVQKFVVDTLKHRLYKADDEIPATPYYHVGVIFHAQNPANISLPARRKRVYLNASMELRAVLSLVREYALDILGPDRLSPEMMGALAMIALDVAPNDINVEPEIGLKVQNKMLAQYALEYQYSDFRARIKNPLVKYDLTSPSSGFDQEGLFLNMIWLHRKLMTAAESAKNLILGYTMHNYACGCEWPDCELARANKHIAQKLPSIVRRQAANISLSV
ncbi:MAG TPA: hypothetical protein VIN59_09670 [Alphaproteobacteria bacterium]